MLMNVSERIQDFWKGFLAETRRAPDVPLYEAFHFGDKEAHADQLSELVLCGKKVATASLLWEYETGDSRPPEPGDLSVVTDWHGSPLCVIETLDVDIRPFEDVGPEFAAAEGEGDLSLEHWRQVHWAYYGRVCKRLARQRSMDMPVVCERFRLIYASSRSNIART